MLKVEKVSKSYGKKVVLAGASFYGAPGECVGIIGANGSGKSTLFSILANMRRGTCEKYEAFGVDLLRYPRRINEFIAYIPQADPLIEELTALDNLRLWYTKSRRDLDAELDHGILKMLGIDEFLRKKVSQMSGGMKKRLSIGCSVSNSAPILLMDEPGAALDMICRENILRFLQEHKARGGIAVLATHDVSELEYCDRIYVLKDGAMRPVTFDGNIHHLVRLL